MEVLVECSYRDGDLAGLEVERLARHIMEAEGLPEGTEVSVAFVDDEEMARLNGAYRGKEGPTDVLSFECDSLDDAFAALPAQDGDIYELGDVIIAPDVAEAQCAQFGCTLREELELLLVHGVLHLCGYDHLEDEEAEAMEARERELLASFRSQREEGADGA